MLCWSLYDAPIYVYVYVYKYANLLNLSSLRNVRKDTFTFYVYVLRLRSTFTFYVYVYVATDKGLYYEWVYVRNCLRVSGFVYIFFYMCE